MTILLELPGDGSLVDRNFQKLAALVPDTGGRSVGIRFGTATLTWPGATQGTSVATVTHGLGKTPVVVVATANNPPVNIWVWTGTPGATTFLLAGQTAAAAPAAATTVSVSWVVIG